MSGALPKLWAQRCSQIRRVVIKQKLSFVDRVMKGLVEVDEESKRHILSDRIVLFSHKHHQDTLDLVIQTLKKHPQIKELHVDHMVSREIADWADLIISVGGDGTFLEASHAISEFCNTPILGVNSSPDSSFGFFCAATMDSFPTLITKLLAGESEEDIKELWRMQIVINDNVQPVMVLNDVLFSCRYPAATARYTLQYKGNRQTQKSSGIWLCTSAGSSGGTLAAGGKILPIYGKTLQFRVREPFLPSVKMNPPERPMAVVLGGEIDKREDLQIIPRMTTGELFVDGAQICIPVKYGDKLNFQPSNLPLTWISSKRCESIRHNLKDIVQKFRTSISDAKDMEYTDQFGWYSSH